MKQLKNTQISLPTPATQLPQIICQDLSLNYGQKPAINNINLTIKSGQITALIGPSGCGKTSFLSCINRLTDLIPHCQIQGKIYLDDIDIFAPKLDTMALRRYVGSIFQKPNPFPLSIWKNLAFPLGEHGIRDRTEIDRIVETALQDVGLWNEVKDRLNSSALNLSGGQQQRLCIARAIALQPKILLMDEPCSALDPLSGGIVEDLITHFRGRYTVVIVTHNLAQARRIADDAALFWVQEGVGHLIEFGRVSQLFDSPQDPLTAAYVNGIRG